MRTYQRFSNRCEHRLNGKLHSFDDLPAIEWDCGIKEWYMNGKRHRDNDLPAYITSDGKQHEWWQFNQRHREAGPAVINADGTCEWFLRAEELTHDEFKRRTVSKTRIGDRTEWRLNGHLHRSDGPAIEWDNGHQQWYMWGLLHRDDGPAVITFNTESWWTHGTFVKSERRYVSIQPPSVKPQYKGKETLCDAVIVVNGKRYKLVEE